MTDHNGNSATRDRYLDIVRKLLAKAEDPACTQAEADALTVKATELMAKYSIDEAMAAARAPERRVVVSKVFTIPAPYATDKLLLLNAITRALGGRAVRLTGNRLHVFGMAADVERIEMLWTSLLIQSAREVSKAYIPAGMRKVTFVKGFLLGFGSEVQRRLEEAEQRARQGAEAGDRSVALVLVDRSSLVHDSVRDAYPRIRRETFSRNAYAHGSGLAAGRRADLGGKRFGASRPAIGG